MYGGLVNLNNLGGASMAHSSNNGFGTFGGAPSQQQKKGDVFSGLMSGQW